MQCSTDVPGRYKQKREITGEEDKKEMKERKAKNVGKNRKRKW